MIGDDFEVKQWLISSILHELVLVDVALTVSSSSSFPMFRRPLLNAPGALPNVQAWSQAGLLLELPLVDDRGVAVYTDVLVYYAGPSTVGYIFSSLGARDALLSATPEALPDASLGKYTLQALSCPLHNT